MHPLTALPARASARRRRRAGTVAVLAAAALAVVPATSSLAADGSPSAPPAYQTVSTSNLNGGLLSDIAGSAFVGKDGNFHFTDAYTGYANDPTQGWANTFTNDDLGAVNSGYGTTTTTTTADAFYATPGALCYQLDKSAVNPVSSPQEDDHCDIIGTWVDPHTGTWHAVINDEYQFDPWNTKGDGATVAQRVSTGLHNDRILLATSNDKGATWKYQGPALTSAWDHNGIVDDTSSPGTTYPFGDSGPRLFVDYSTGYFYISYNVKIYKKPAASTVASWTEMARAPISGNMAPGTWKKYYDGSWSQPGIGGIDGSIGGPAGLGMSYDPTTDVVAYTGTDAAGHTVNAQASTVPSDHILTFSDAAGSTYTANTLAHTIVDASGATVPAVDYTDPITGESVDIVAKNDVYQDGVKTFTGGIYVTWTNSSTGAQTVQQIITGSSVWKDADSGILFHQPLGNNESAVSYDAYSESYRIVGYDGNVYETSDLGDPSSWKVVGTLPDGSFGGYLTTLDDGSLTNQNVTGASFLTVSDLSGAVTRVAMPQADQQASTQRRPEDTQGKAVVPTAAYAVTIGNKTLGASGRSGASTQWKLVPVTDPASPAGSGFYRLQNTKTGTYLQVNGSTPAAQRAMGATAKDGAKLPDADPSGNGGVGAPGGSDQWYVQVVAPNAQSRHNSGRSASPTSLAGSTTYRLVNRNSGLALEYNHGAFRLEQQSPGDAGQYLTFSTHAPHRPPHNGHGHPTGGGNGHAGNRPF